MSRLRYIGSKARISDQIIAYIGPPDGRKFVDLFAGTGIVSRKALLHGWYVYANDYLYSSTVTTEAQLISTDEVPFRKLEGYQAVVEVLNALTPLKGFIYREYSSSGESFSGDSRMYFTCENAMRIDAVRQKIANWSDEGLISDKEEHLLLADLLGAVNQVANIAGTYGCFLTSWTLSAKRKLQIINRRLHERSHKYEVTCQDAFSVSLEGNELVYLDPPYTKRQYASYYHLLETIAYGDEPEVSGVSGLRPWKHKSSPFCYRRKAGQAFDQLITKLSVPRIVISYSSEGQVTIEELTSRLSKLGAVTCITIGSIGRYRPNVGAANGAERVDEFIIDLDLNKPLRPPQFSRLEKTNEQLKLF